MVGLFVAKQSVLIQANLQILVFVEARKLAEIVCHLIRAKLIKSVQKCLLPKTFSSKSASFSQDI
jgi:hypothetical protein